ncbi:MobF family relaxase [cf. Phormidesmis sp. LEGE 11477]|uniref:MobF family relaxase n=1 Tax=cf. Phormidesmis sp. LEGE 11477 TaxID=1828680 RepID=UPI0018813DC7|nr:MobF family relaxase [cf. Phormidesmis sp. LEGE 11477]MBE9061117.1 relaxase domain-containing protein [cf. Phormidesmis sp. LEGE 11477]
MLSTSNLSAAQAENYFVKDDYYTEEEQHEASFWLGKGASNLGLTGTVEKAVFGELLSGTGPNGEVLSGKEIDPKKRRAATDFTFSAPKSVSIAALVQKDERVLAAHHQAVAKALSVLEERYAQTRISTEMGRQRLTTGNLIAAVFPHATNREAEPQLHSHCVVMNATQLPDGQWFSFANEQAIANKKLLGQIYQNELAIALQKHGYVIEPKAHGQFELVGYSAELLKLFSTRRQQIEALVALWKAEGKTVFSEDGQVLRSRLALYEAAALKSRKRKPTPMQPEQLRQGWNALAQVEGLALPELPTANSRWEQADQVEAIASDVEAASTLSKTLSKPDIEPAIAHCSEREAVFRRTALERFALEHQLGQQSFDQLQAAIEGSSELIRIDETRMTTQAAIRLELETIRLMQGGQGQVKEIALPEEIEQLLGKSPLTAEQRQAILQTLTCSDSVMAWQGSAGAGKTYTLNELKLIAQDKGLQVRGFAPSAEAAHTLGESLKIETSTVAGLLVSSVEEETAPAIWFVDEAGLLSMKDAHALLIRAQQEGARVLLVGDTKQLSAVEAGNPFKSLQAGGIALARLDHSLRQKTEELKLAVRLISEGNVARGIDVLEQAECLHLEPKLSGQINQMVSDYISLSPGAREETLLLAGTNQERGVLTAQLRQALQTEGSLGEDALKLLSLRRKDLTTVQARYVSAYVAGDVLIPTQDYKKQGLVKYQQYVVRGVDKEANQLVVETVAGQLLKIDPARCDRKTVYRVQPINIAVGDKLRWTKNDRAAKTRNGQQFTVAEIDAAGKVMAVDELGQGRWFDLSGRSHVDYAWVSTTYGSQGKTAERVLALMGEKTTNREAFYVAVSRAKHGLKLYTADKHELIRKAQVSRAKENASDYVLLGQKGETYGKTQKENCGGEGPSTDGGDIGQRVGDGVGECLAAEFAGELSTRAGRGERTQPTGEFTGTGDAGFDGELELVADILSQQVESLYCAVAEYVEQSEFIECEGLFARAVEAVDFGFEQLERAAKNRNKLAAAVDRFDAAVGKQAGEYRGGQESVIDEVEQSHLASQVVAERQADSIGKSQREVYIKLWNDYSEGVQAENAVKLDLLVGRAAVKDGRSRKEVWLMLTAGSTIVKQIREMQGAKEAMNYIRKTLTACQQKQPTNSANSRKQSRQRIEIGD